MYVFIGKFPKLNSLVQIRFPPTKRYQCYIIRMQIKRHLLLPSPNQTPTHAPHKSSHISLPFIPVHTTMPTNLPTTHDKSMQSITANKLHSWIPSLDAVLLLPFIASSECIISHINCNIFKVSFNSSKVK